MTAEPGVAPPRRSLRPAVNRPLLMRVPKRVIRWLLAGRQLFWPIRCPHCRMPTRQMHAGETPHGGILRLCLACRRIFSRKESRDAQKGKRRR